MSIEKQAEDLNSDSEATVHFCDNIEVENVDAPVLWDGSAMAALTYDMSLPNFLFSNDNIANNENLNVSAPLFSIMPAEHTKMPIETTYTDPILHQIILGDVIDNQDNFDAEAETLKLQKFLEGNGQENVVTDKLLKLSPEMPSTAYRIIRCFNCTALFDIITFQNHTCEYDSSHNLIDMSTIHGRKASPVFTIPPQKKPGSERIIMENQIRIRRHLKDELKFDLSNSYETVADKKSKGPNECTMCERKFVHASGLVRHMEKHAMDLIPTNMNSTQTGCQMVHGLRLVLKCGDCGRLFYDFQLAREHVDTHQAVRTEFKLLEENSTTDFKTFVSESEATLDSITEFNDMSHLSAVSMLEQKCKDVLKTPILTSVLQCEFCEYVFSDVSYLFVHAATHFPERPFECTACDITMSTLKEHTNHYQTECGYMRENMKQLQITLQRYYVCNICENKFHTVEQLYEHRYAALHYFPREDKNQRRLIMPCEYCETMFLQASEALVHYELKHFHKKKREKEVKSTNLTASGRLRQYLCDICGKSYTQSSHLWQHLRFHQGVKPFVCQENGCGRKFTIRPDLNDHIRKCHTGERPYHCLVCGKRFLTGSVFYQHRLIHRGERRYECDECGKRFYRADALKNHQRIHTGEKPYSCLFCTKTFRQRGDRDKHIRARHAHLDANSRLMMQMQKYQLEAAAAVAALKAKKIQENGEQPMEPDPSLIAEMFPSRQPSSTSGGVMMMSGYDNSSTVEQANCLTGFSNISMDSMMASETPNLFVESELPNLAYSSSAAD